MNYEEQLAKIGKELARAANSPEFKAAVSNFTEASAKAFAYFAEQVGKAEQVRKAEGQSFACFSHNGCDVVYHKKTPYSMKAPFLVVSDYFDTPSESVTKTLDFICDALNEREQEG